MSAGTELLRGAPLLALGLACVVAGLLGLVGALATRTDREPAGVARSLAAVRAVHAAPDDARQAQLRQPLVERALGPVMAGVTALGRRVTPAAQAARTRRRLDLAGNPGGWDVDRVASVKVLLTVVGTALTLIVCLAVAAGLWRGAAAVLAVGALAWSTPSLVVYQLAYNRSQQVLRSLPDALDLLTISVESGLGFDAAVAQVARNSEGPLAEELVRVLQEMQIGTGRVDALRALAQRTDVADLRSFVSAMVQADAYGVPIAAVLRVQADEMRTKRSQRAEEAAQRVPVKILFPLIFGILPALLVVVVGPGVLQAFQAFSRF